MPTTHTILIASNNAHKLHEFNEIFALAGAGESIRLVTPRDLGVTLDPDETADTYLGNAQIKARAFRALPGLQDLAGLSVMADDSGLEVDALGGRPGILSARYSKAAPGGDGCAALLDELRTVPDAQRTARFRCAIVLVAPDGTEHAVEGVCDGVIGRDKRSQGGFGFDPVFVPNVQPAGEHRHLAQLSSQEKHRISHRGIAARKVLAYLLEGQPLRSPDP